MSSVRSPLFIHIFRIRFRVTVLSSTVPNSEPGNKSCINLKYPSPLRIDLLDTRNHYLELCIRYLVAISVDKSTLFEVWQFLFS